MSQRLNASPVAGEELALLAKALGHPARVRILELLLAKDACCGEIVDELPLAQATVSQHLKVLKDAGLVLDHRDGTRRIYSLNPTGLEELRAYLDEFWRRSLAAFKEAAEHQAEEHA